MGDSCPRTEKFNVVNINLFSGVKLAGRKERKYSHHFVIKEAHSAAKGVKGCCIMVKQLVNSRVDSKTARPPPSFMSTMHKTSG